jgi:hypothetical protein
MRQFDEEIRSKKVNATGDVRRHECGRLFDVVQHSIVTVDHDAAKVDRLLARGLSGQQQTMSRLMRSQFCEHLLKLKVSTDVRIRDKDCLRAAG